MSNGVAGATRFLTCGALRCQEIRHESRLNSAWKSHLYFAYGSNLDHEGMARRCPDSGRSGRATLEGWQLTFQGVADIRRRAGARTQGALWRISDRDLERLDTYEGYPSLYGRERSPS